MKKLKNIKLILPDEHRFCANFSTFETKGLRLSHLGLLIIGEMLRKERDCSVEVFDEKIKPVSMAELEGADAVGISIQTLAAVRGYQLAEWIKNQLKIPVILGGVHATLNPNEALEHADYVVRNEGEYTFLELIDALENNIIPDDIAGLSFKHNGETYHNHARPFLADLDVLPFPNWKLIKGMFRAKETTLNIFIYPMQVTRGCPFNCTFCSVTPTFGKRLRHRSVESVLEEIKSNWKIAQYFIFFYDDNIVGNKKYFKDLLSALIDYDLVPKAWHSQMRADVAQDEELVDLMTRTHCTAGTFGFESVNPASLEEMKKGQTLDTIEYAIETMHAHEIFIVGFFVFGFQNDTTESIEETIKFASEKGIDLVGFMPLTPFPGTPQFEEMKERIISQYWELYDVQHVVFYPENMTPFELYRNTLDAYIKFYDRKVDKYPNAKKTKLQDIRTLSHRQLFENIVRRWDKRTRWLHELELVANERYMAWLNSLPKQLERGKIKNYTIDFENLELHAQLKTRRRGLPA